MSPGSIALSRWGSLAVILLVALRFPSVRRLVGARAPTKLQGLGAFALGVCFLAPAHVMYYTSMGKTSTIVGAVFNATAPVWTAIFAFFFLRERLPWNRTVALVFGSVGAYIVAVGFAIPTLGSSDMQSNLLYLGGTMIESLGGVLAMTLVRRSSGLTILSAQVVGATLAFAIAPFLLGSTLPLAWPHAWSWPAFGAMSYLVLISGMFCFGMWYYIAEKVPLSYMVIVLLIQPIVSAVLGVWLRGEKVSWEEALGSVLILCALIIASLEKSRRSRSLPHGEDVPGHQRDNHNHG